MQPELDIWVVPPDAAAGLLGVSAQEQKEAWTRLKECPTRGKGHAIVPCAPQWVGGDNEALEMFRKGVPANRTKMWFQSGDPLTDGFIITRGGLFAGVGHGLQLMRAVADMQVARNRQIMHSIEYASVIQQSLLRSSREALARACPGADLVWEPRDVVGGDFYQFSQDGDGWFATVADCTGHGVPGAFMTLIATSSLGQAIKEHGPRDPAALLPSAA